MFLSELIMNGENGSSLKLSHSAMKSADHHRLEHHNYHRYHQYDHSAQGGGHADKGGTKRKSE